MSEVRTTATRYEVTNYPDPESPNAYHFTLWVEHRGGDRWCVTDGNYCYRKDGHKGYERRSSSRTDRFKNAYRFSLEDALALAQKQVPKLRLHAGPQRKGMTADEVWEWEQGK